MAPEELDHPGAQPRPLALRASDDDRERTADILRRAAGEGRLTVQELDDRLHTAFHAQALAELEALTADVVVHQPHPAATTEGTSVTVRPGEDGTKHLIAIMSGVERKGHWRLGRRCTVVNLMGGSDLDLNDVELAADEVEIRMYSIMGGGSIRVPDGVHVEVSEFGFMGGNDVDIGRDPVRPGAPRIKIRLVSVMGGAEIRRGRKKSRAEKREARVRARDERHALRHEDRPDRG